MKTAACILYAKVVVNAGIQDIFGLETERNAVARTIGKSCRVHSLIWDDVWRVELCFTPKTQETIGFKIFWNIAEIIFPDKRKIIVHV